MLYSPSSYQECVALNINQLFLLMVISLHFPTDSHHSVCTEVIGAGLNGPTAGQTLQFTAVTDGEMRMIGLSSPTLMLNSFRFVGARVSSSVTK